MNYMILNLIKPVSLKFHYKLQYSKTANCTLVPVLLYQKQDSQKSLVSWNQSKGLKNFQKFIFYFCLSHLQKSSSPIQEVAGRELQELVENC